MDAHPNSGALFVRDKKSPNAPDYGGDLTIDGEVLDHILARAQRGEPVTLEIAGWQKQGRNGTRFISINGKVPYKERQQNQPYNSGGSFVPGQQQRNIQAPQRPQQSIQTSRGQYTQQGGQVGHSQNTIQRQMRNVLNDDLPENLGGNPPRQRRPADNSPPWE